MRKVFLVVEGQGDEQALPKLLHRFTDALGFEPHKNGRELRPLDPMAKPPKDPEASRDAKGLLSGWFPKTHPYRETSHQYAMTAALPIDDLRASGLACVGSLERALTFVLTATEPGVYPPSKTSSLIE